MGLGRAAATRRVVVMGVAGSGKSTVAAAVANRFGYRFVDADDVHPPSNVAKMSAGIPLTDEDRWPWLARLREELIAGDVIVTCSALARRYRNFLREADGVQFVFLDLDPDTAFARATSRSGHFMGPGMIASQFAALERPGPDETDIVRVDASADIEAVIEASINAIALNSPPSEATTPPDGGS